MLVLIVFSFVAGIVTILSPCILPILPIILSSSTDTTGKRRPFGVVVGFVLSFTFFTLFLSTIVRLSGIPAESLRFLSIFILIAFGLSLLVPAFQVFLESLFARLSRFAPNVQNRRGFGGGVIVGLSLGLLWTPCVGPILASVISLALSGTVTAQAVIITLAYSIGTAVPMFIIMQAGSRALQKVPGLVKNTGKIQKAFGVLMILTAIGIFFNIDRKFQSFILDTFPQYGVGLTKLEDNEAVKKELAKVNENPMDETQIGKPMSDVVAKGPLAPEIIAGGQWLNSEPLRLSELRGKVVLVDFWTYSCINCQRTFPYLRDWWEKYKDDGLVIIGVHSPEFEFEKDVDNVREAAADFDLTYPIVQDNDFATWRAYSNRYWPAKYFIDKDGIIRGTHFGEGAYDESEKLIQKLLSETGSDISQEIDNPEYEIYSRTPEIYLGSKRYNGQNYINLEGDYIQSDEYLAFQKGAQLSLNFEAKNVYLVMNPTEESARVDVYLDGEFLKSVEVTSDSLYELVNLEAPGKHELKLEFPDGNIRLFAFTFG